MNREQEAIIQAKAIRHEDLVAKVPNAPVGYQRKTLRAAQRALHERLAAELGRKTTLGE